MNKIIRSALILLLIISVTTALSVAEDSTSSEIDLEKIDLSKVEKKEEEVMSLNKIFSADFDNKITYIKANSLTLKTEEHLFIYSGDVELKQGDLTMTADTLEGRYTEENQLESITAAGKVVVTKGKDVRATGEKAFYNSTAQTVTLTENPELNQEGNILSADRIVFYLKEDRSVAEGMVRVKVSQPEQSAGSIKSLADK